MYFIPLDRNLLPKRPQSSSVGNWDSRVFSCKSWTRHHSCQLLIHTKDWGKEKYSKSIPSRYVYFVSKNTYKNESCPNVKSVLLDAGALSSVTNLAVTAASSSHQGRGDNTLDLQRQKGTHPSSQVQADTLVLHHHGSDGNFQSVCLEAKLDELSG